MLCVCVIDGYFRSCLLERRREALVVAHVRRRLHLVSLTRCAETLSGWHLPRFHLAFFAKPKQTTLPSATARLRFGRHTR